MSDDLVRTSKQQIRALRRERDQLAEQIRRSKETISRSQELIERLNAILAQAGPEPVAGRRRR